VGGPRHRADAIRNFLNGWEGFHAEVEEYRELDDKRVLVLARRHGGGKTSGLS
jgi:hypothetical protein